MAPQLLAKDPALAEKVRQSLSRLKGVHLTMPDAGKALADLGAATEVTPIKFKNGNGNNEPKEMDGSAWDRIIAQAGKTEGWHIFGLAVFDGYHSVTVFVDNRPDGPRVYWADQWAIEQGDDFHQESSSVSGFRRYEKAGFDAFIVEKTNEWWNDVHSPDSKCGKKNPKTWDSSCRYDATLKIWHLRSGSAAAGGGTVQRKALSAVPLSIQREVAETASEKTPSGMTESLPASVPAAQTNSRVSKLIVEDNAASLGPGQMRKSQFVAQLRSNIAKDASPLLAKIGQTTDHCPYLNSWLDFYETQDSQHIERAVLKYASETLGAATAQDYIAIVRRRAMRAVAIWVATGKVTGVPPGLPHMPDGTHGNSAEKDSPTASMKVMAKAKDAAPSGASDAGSVASRLGSGQQFDGSIRTRMESAFGESFSGVRLHTGSNATSLCSDLSARAFTVGSNVAFGPGEYKPGTLAGDALIAHELAHVVQQRNGASNGSPQLKGGDNNALEADADNSAAGAVVSLWGKMKGAAGHIGQSALPRLKSGLGLQRCSGCNTEKEDKTEDGGAKPQRTDGGAVDSGITDAGTPVPACATTTDPCEGKMDADKIICSNIPTPDV
ncbi:MAG TPA: DUF4157 domain-containing protein, partial [Terriglobales bacterium]|nr:DUF4157 domain-containing protein [Terriglobales bacterium]